MAWQTNINLTGDIEVRTVSYENFYLELDGFRRLPGKIESVTKEAFESVYGSIDASNAKNIIYFFIAEKPVPRLNGESRILYIGQTKNSFKTRYHKLASLHTTTKANVQKFKAIIEHYGSIEIVYCDYKKFGNTLLEAEGQFLWWYFQNHSEYPPINYSKTKIRNDVITIK